jgi:hypothetical protein
LSYLERYTLVPDGSGQPGPPGHHPASHRWVAGAAQYIGTMLVHHAGATPELAARLHGELARAGLAAAAVDLVEPGLIVGRLLDASGAGFSAARAAFREGVLDAVFGGPRLVARR